MDAAGFCLSTLHPLIPAFAAVSGRARPLPLKRHAKPPRHAVQRIAHIGA